MDGVPDVCYRGGMRLPLFLCVVWATAAPAADPVPAPAGEATEPAAKPEAAKKRVVFRVSGAQAWSVAAAAGWKFHPEGASGPRDGRNTVVQLHPGLTTSQVNGPRMTQIRQLGTWSRVSQNTFYMFAGADGRAKPLADGWKVLDLRLTGQHWTWVTKPKAGGTSPSFAVRLTGQRATTDTVVDVAELVLEGPPEAKDWRPAFGGAEKPAAKTR